MDDANIHHRKAALPSPAPTHEADLQSRFRQIINRSALNGCLAKWAVLLQQYGIKYVPSMASKGQLVDFFAAHLVLDDLPLTTKLLDEEIMTIAPQEGWDIYLVVLLEAQHGKEKK